MYEYQVGGSLPPSAPTYVKRQADKELYQALLKSEFSYVLTSRQMGKSSLRVRMVQQLQSEGIRCGVVDITAIGTQQVGIEQWYASFLGSLVSSLRLKFNLKQWWKERDYLSPIRRLGEFIETVILGEISSKIVIFIDEIDSILALKFPVDDFFALIRDCYNKRADNDDYNRLSFTLLGVATPQDLINDKRRTPFNIGHSIELKGFTLQEALPLLQGLKEKVPHPELILETVLAWTGGQPFLTQKICQLIVDQIHLNNKIADVEFINQLVQEEIINNWEVHDEPEHLKTIRDRLLKNEQKVARLLGLYKNILKHNSVMVTDSQDDIELLLSGLVIKENNQLVIRNRIYREIFNESWIDRQLDKLRPYAQAMLSWIESNYTDESRLLRGKALQEAKIWTESHSLSDQDYLFLSASQELEQREMKQVLELAKAKAITAQLNYQSSYSQRQNFILSFVSLLLFISLGVSYLFFNQYRSSLADQVTKLYHSSLVLAKANQQLDSLLLFLEIKQIILKNNLGNVPNIQHSFLDVFESINQFYQIDLDFSNQAKIAYNPDKNVIFFQNKEGEIISGLLPKLTLTKINNVTMNSGRSTNILAFNPHNLLLASGTWDGSIILWNEQGKMINKLSSNSLTIKQLEWSNDGQLLASVTQDGNINIWKKTGQLLTTIKANCQSINCLLWTKNNQLLTSSNDDKTLKLWTKTGELLDIITNTEDITTNFIQLPKSELILSGTNNNKLKIWSIQQNKLKLFQTINMGCNLQSLAVNNQKKILAIGNDHGEIILWKIKEKNNRFIFQEIKTFKGHNQSVYQMIFNTQQNQLISLSEDRTLRFWNLDHPAVHIPLLTNNSQQEEEKLFNSSQKIQYEYQESKRILKIALTNLKFTTIMDLEEPLVNLAINHNQTLIATLNKNGNITVWSRQGKRLFDLTSPEGKLTKIVFNSSKNQLLAMNNHRIIFVWSLDILADNDRILAESCNWVQDYLNSQSSSLKTLCETVDTWQWIN